MKNNIKILLPLIISLLCTKQATGAIQFAEMRNMYIPTYPQCVRIADMNGDGLKDAVVCSYFYLYVYMQQPDGNFKKPQVYRCGLAFNLAIGDLNGDGKVDVAVGSNWSGESLNADSLRV